MILSFPRCRAICARKHTHEPRGTTITCFATVKIANLAIDMSRDRNFARMDPVCESSYIAVFFRSRIFWVLAIYLLLSQTLTMSKLYTERMVLLKCLKIWSDT